jgi:hypothetical protein
MTKKFNTRETRLIENEIFRLREKADSYLRAGDTDSFNHIQNTISHLQEVHGAVKGAKEREGDERTA